MKIKPFIHPQDAYARILAEKLESQRPDKIYTPTEQPESTKRLLAMSDEEHEKHLANSSDMLYWIDLKEKAKATTPVRKVVDEFDNIIDPYAIPANAARRRDKNTIGASTKSVASDIQKERAKDAWLYTPGKTFEELSDAEKLNVKAEPVVLEVTKVEKEEWKPMTTWQAFKHWLKGGKVKKDDKPKTWRDL